MEMRVVNVVAAAGLMVALNGCGGGGSTVGGGGGPTDNAISGGIWRGQESVSGLQVTGLVDESGNFHFIRGDSVQYVGVAKTSGGNVTADIEGITPLGYAFADGSVHGTGSLSGTIAARKTITSTTQFKTDLGNANSGTLNLTFDALYNRASALSTLSGNFTNTANNVVVTVGTNGSLFSQDAVSGCVLNGTASTINANFNLYKVQFDFANCAGTSSALNGLDFTGVATLDNTVTPERIIVGATAISGNRKFSAVLQLNRT